METLYKPWGSYGTSEWVRNTGKKNDCHGIGGVTVGFKVATSVRHPVDVCTCMFIRPSPSCLEEAKASLIVDPSEALRTTSYASQTLEWLKWTGGAEHKSMLGRDKNMGIVYDVSIS